MTSRLCFVVSDQEGIPTVGTHVSVPVEGGSEWFELGIIEDAHWRSTGEVEFVLRLHPNLKGIELQGAESDPTP